MPVWISTISGPNKRPSSDGIHVMYYDCLPVGLKVSVLLRVLFEVYGDLRHIRVRVFLVDVEHADPKSLLDYPFHGSMHLGETFWVHGGEVQNSILVWNEGLEELEEKIRVYTERLYEQ